MDESRRLAMRRRHLAYVTHCTCGMTVHGNGARASHKAMHRRRGDGHFGLTTDGLAALQARGEYPCVTPPPREYLDKIVREDEAKRLSHR